MSTNSNAQDETVTFADLALAPKQQEILENLGFETPTPIQAGAIPVLLEGNDVIGIAQTGTGKTAAFGLPLLQRTPKAPQVGALVLAPTRELALQTTSALEDLAGPDSDLGVLTVYGGSPYGPQLRALREGVQVVVGTPGRIIDLLDRGALDLSHVRTVVLDEADEMLKMGFAEEVDKILSSVPEDRLTALFSATMPDGIQRVAKTHLRDPRRVQVDASASTVDTIDQTYAVVPHKMRFEALCRFLGTSDAGAAIVFVRTRADAEEVALALSGRGFRAAGISGDVAQRDRERLVEGLRKGALDVLVATDVAARGLDVERVELVVNYEVPREDEQYVHRIGRTGRAGREGKSLTFFGPKDLRKLKSIERTTGTKMVEVKVPTAAEVRAGSAANVLDSALSRPASDVVFELLDAKREEGLRYRDIAAALLTAAASPKALGESSAASQDRMDDAFAVRVERDRRDGRGSSGKGGRYRIEVGKRDGVSAGGIIGTITSQADIPGSAVGKITIFPSFSIVETTQPLSGHQLRSLDRAVLRGRKLRIAPDRGPSKGRRQGFKRR